MLTWIGVRNIKAWREASWFQPFKREMILCWCQLIRGPGSKPYPGPPWSLLPAPDGTLSTAVPPLLVQELVAWLGRFSACSWHGQMSCGTTYSVHCLIAGPFKPFPGLNKDSIAPSKSFRMEILSRNKKSDGYCLPNCFMDLAWDSKLTKGLDTHWWY